MKRVAWLAAGWLWLVTSATGCKENPAATAACKGKAGNSHVCNSCCRLNGASGSVWSGNCSCIGGN